MSLAKIQRKRLSLLMDYDMLLLEKDMCAQSLDTTYHISKRDGLTDEVKKNIAEVYQVRQNKMTEIKANLTITQRKLKFYKKMYKDKCRTLSLKLS